jgi:hypothetical protein
VPSKKPTRPKTRAIHRPYIAAPEDTPRAIQQLAESVIRTEAKIPGVFTADSDGFVPESGGGTTTFLRADGTWAAASGGLVPTTRNLGVTSPITGGGDLSADRTFGFDQAVALGNNARVTVRKNTGADVGVRRRLNLIEGANVTLTVADDAGNEEVDVTIAASSSGITPKRVVGATFDGQGSAPTAGSVAYVVVPFNGTIDQWYIVSDASGSCVVDVWKAAGSIPTDANRIAGTEKPTLSAAQLASDTALTTWSTLVVTVGDVFGFELESASTLTRVSVEVRIAEAA